MRLIDADKILYFKGKDIVGEDAYITQKDVIDEMPTVEADVVRCKDCKYWNRLKTVEMCARTMPAMRMTEDDFCSRGEKRGEEMRLIDADKLKEDVLSWENCYNGYSDVYDKARIVDAIDEMPTVDTERHGHWKDVQNYYDDVYYECSACGEPWILLDGTPSDNNMNYCPHCGALMNEEVEEDEID